MKVLSITRVDPQLPTFDIDVDLSKRRFLIGGGVAGLSLLATACPFDGITKDKAVRYCDIGIGYLNDIRPLAQQLGGAQVVALIDRGIPALEKLKEALEKSDLPTAGNLFDNVTSILSQLATALLQLPASPRRDTAIGILTLVNITLRTVRLFVKSETPSTAAASRIASDADTQAVMRAFEATRF